MLTDVHILCSTVNDGGGTLTSCYNMQGELAHALVGSRRSGAS
jgi:hypothetical protein